MSAPAIAIPAAPLAVSSRRGVDHHRSIRIQPGPAQNRLQRFHGHKDGRQAIPGRPEDPFHQIDGPGQMAHDVVVNVGLHVQDHQLVIANVVC